MKKLTAILLSAIFCVVAGAANAGSESGPTEQWVVVTVTTCWTIPFTGGIKFCETHNEIVAAELVDDFLAGKV